VTVTAVVVRPPAGGLAVAVPSVVLACPLGLLAPLLLFLLRAFSRLLSPLGLL
jgi:hypothetical protein